MIPDGKDSFLRSLILKVAGRCNLNCTYCYMYNHSDQSSLNRPAVMSPSIYEQTLMRCAEYCERRPGHQLAIVFHGGEPTLIGPEMLGSFCHVAIEVLGTNLSGFAIQTNATILTPSLVSVIKEYRMAVGVSIDGPPAVHDALRIYHSGKGSHAATVRGIDQLHQAGLLLNALCVINPLHDGLAAYRHIRSLNINSMDFLLPDETHDSKQLIPARKDSRSIARYLISIFDEWFEEDNPAIRIRIFEDIIRTSLGGHASLECFANTMQDYLIVETDGSIHSNDVLKICGEAISDSTLNVMTSNFDNLDNAPQAFRDQVYRTAPLSIQCQNCAELNVCGGGTPPHRYSKANGFSNPSVWCDDLLAIIRHIKSRLE